MDKNRNKLYQQIVDAGGNVMYTYVAHWNIVKRLKRKDKIIKLSKIVLTAFSAGGFFTSELAGIPWFSWVGGFTSAVTLALILYSLNFNLPIEIKAHTDAANELWDVKEAYRSLLIDFGDLTNDEIRNKRDSLTEAVSCINKKYLGTDDKSYAKAKKKINDYKFEDNEAANLIHVSKK